MTANQLADELPPAYEWSERGPHDWTVRNVVTGESLSEETESACVNCCWGCFTADTTITREEWVRLQGLEVRLESERATKVMWRARAMGLADGYDWDKWNTDAAIGIIYGLKSQTVANARRARGIPPHTAYNKSTRKIDWDNESRLGKMPDRMLQRLLKIGSSASVSAARQRRGIPKFVRPNADDMLLAIRSVQQVVENAKGGNPMIDYELLEAILMANNLLPKEKKK